MTFLEVLEHLMYYSPINLSYPMMYLSQLSQSAFR